LDFDALSAHFAATALFNHGWLLAFAEAAYQLWEIWRSRESHAEAPSQHVSQDATTTAQSKEEGASECSSEHRGTSDAVWSDGESEDSKNGSSLRCFLEYKPAS